jgi:anti-sigma factor RsiW
MRLPGVDSVDELGGRLAAHVETCLTCQAEAARYRTLRRRLGTLADETISAPETLVPAVVAGMEPPAEDERRGTALKRAAIAASAAAGAAVAAGAGTIIVMGLRRTRTAA